MINVIWFFGAATFAFENMASFALAVNLLSYFTKIMHYELSDAANMVTNYSGVSYILSIAVAIVADTLIGRYKTVLISGFIECLVRFFQIARPPHIANYIPYSTPKSLISVGFVGKKRCER